MRLPFALVAALVGIAVGWVPAFVHGPIAEKFDLYYLRGDVMVWAWYWARSSVGLWIGLTVWPRAWWLRGPLVGVLALVPPAIVSLAVPSCGATCAAVNLTSGAVLGLVVAAITRAVTGRDHG